MLHHKKNVKQLSVIIQFHVNSLRIYSEICGKSVTLLVREWRCLLWKAAKMDTSKIIHASL